MNWNETRHNNNTIALLNVTNIEITDPPEGGR